MLPDNLRDRSLAAAVDAFDGDALKGGQYERGGLTLGIAPAKIASICGFLKYDQQFVRLSTVTAVDRWPAEPRFEVVYHLHSVARNERVRLMCRISGESPTIETVTGVWRCANWYEREVFDLFGIHFVNHPNLTRILMP